MWWSWQTEWIQGSGPWHVSIVFFLLTYIECCSHLHYTQTIQALDTRLVTFNMNLLLNMESADFWKQKHWFLVWYSCFHCMHIVQDTWCYVQNVLLQHILVRNDLSLQKKRVGVVCSFCKGPMTGRICISTSVVSSNITFLSKVFGW